jgi:hypothetical protein
MQALHGEKAYDFVPITFIYPQEIENLKKEMRRRQN